MGQHHTSDLAQGAFRNAGGLRIDIACRHWKTRLSCCRARGSFCWWPPGLLSIFAAFGAPVICLSPLPKGSGRGTLGGGSWSYQCWFGVLPTTIYIYICIYIHTWIQYGIVKHIPILVYVFFLDLICPSSIYSRTTIYMYIYISIHEYMKVS